MTDFFTSDAHFLSFETPDRVLFGGSVAPPQVAYLSDDDFLFESGPKEFPIIDTDLGPFGAAKVNGFFDLTFGFEFNASLGGLPTFSTGIDILSNVKFAPVIFEGTPQATDSNGVSVQRFDFTDAQVLTARSNSQGFADRVAFADQTGEDRTAPIGLELNVIAGLTAELRDMAFRLPLSTKTRKVDDITLVDVKPTPFNLFKLDAASPSIDIELNDFVKLSLKVPTGASTKGSSTGATIVSDKGFSTNPFVALNGDLDALLIEGLKKIPKLVPVAKFLEESVFFDVEEDFADFVPFLDEKEIVLEISLADLSGTAGLHITEEVTVDYGFTDNIEEGFSFILESDVVDNIRQLTSGEEAKVPGEGETPNVRVTLVSDNGTPDIMSDDRVVQGHLGEEIDVPTPEGTLGSDIIRDVTVDAFFDIDQAKVSHQGGLGGKFASKLTILGGAIGGDLGSKLGISFGPLFSTELPEGGIKLGLVDFLQNTLALEGGRYELTDDGGLADPGADTRLEQLGYEPGDFGDAPNTASYSYVYSRTRPEGFDEVTEQSIEDLRTFGLALSERIEFANSEIADFFDPFDTQVTLLGADRELEDIFREGTLALWVGGNSGPTLADRLASVALNPTEGSLGSGNAVLVAPRLFDADGNPRPIESQMIFGRLPSVFSEGLGGAIHTERDFDLAEGISEFFDDVEFAITDRSGDAAYQFDIGSEFLLVRAQPLSGFTGGNTMPIPVNLIGTSADDGLIYTGSKSAKPRLIDGGGLGADSDTFYANFDAVHGINPVTWNARAQQLAEEADPRLERLEGDLGDAGVEAGAFGGGVVTIGPDGIFQDEITLRDIESYVVRFGDGDDRLRLGTQGEDYIEMGGGADVLAISTDAFNDRFDLGAGDDLAVVFRTTDGGTDEIAGGPGTDEVFFSEDRNDVFTTTPAQQISGVEWRIGSRGSAQGADELDDDPAAAFALATALGDFFLTEPLGTPREDEDAWSGVFQQRLTSAVEVFSFGDEFGTSTRIGPDVEAVSYRGGNLSSDAVFYLGGDVYRGGTLNAFDPDDPADLFIADFGQWSSTVDPDSGAVLLGANAEDLVGELVFADALVEGFEQFFVRGTDLGDVFQGAFLTDVFDAGAGNDDLRSSGGADLLIGGLGDDVFTVTLEDREEQNTRVIGDRAASLNLGTRALNAAPLSAQDGEDLAVIRPGFGVADDTEDRGLRYSLGSAFRSGESGLGADASLDDLLLAKATIAVSASFFGAATKALRFGPDGGDAGEVVLERVERTNVVGTNAHDDLLIFDGGASYIAGERPGDADVLLADFSADTMPIVLTLPEDNRAGVRLDNGTFLQGIDRIFANFGSGDDTITGGTLDDFIDGGDGDDALTGEGGNDSLIGGAGDDLIYWEGDDGNDTAEGGTGFDRLIVSNMDDDGAALTLAGLSQTVTAGTASATVSAAANSGSYAILLDLLGSASALSIAAGTSNSVTYGGFEAIDVAGSDSFDDAVLFQGGEIYAGGERAGDADVFIADLSDATQDLRVVLVDAAPGDPRENAFYDLGNGTRIGEFERFHVRLGVGDDEAEGGAFDDVFLTGDGNDTVRGSGGTDLYELGRGDDAATFDEGTATIRGGAGRDWLQIGAQPDGFDRLELESGNSGVIRVDDDLTTRQSELFRFVRGASRGEEVRLRGDNAKINFADVETITASGDASADILVAGTEAGLLSGDGGQDILIGLGGNDLMLGGQGRDSYVLVGNFGEDTIAGEWDGDNHVHLIGQNLDTATFSTDVEKRDLIIAFNSLAILTIRDYFAGSANPQNIRFFDNAAPVTGRILDASTLGLGITAPAGPAPEGRQILGSEASDLIDGGTDGADQMFGFAGNDFFVSSPGPDVFDGATGRDLVSFEGATTGVRADLSNGTERSSVFAFSGTPGPEDFFVSVEDLRGSGQADSLVGNAQGNRISGLDGRDLVLGAGGDDILTGGNGADTLSGDGGDDLIFGGAGNDVVLGGSITNARGNDIIDGGDGNDLMIDRFGDNAFRGGAGNDTAQGGSGADLYIYADGRDASGVRAPGTGGRDIFEAHEVALGFPDGPGDGVDFSPMDEPLFIQLDHPSASVPGAGADEIEGFAFAGIVGAERRVLDFVGVENAVGGGEGDFIQGSDADNLLEGDGGDDTLIGRAGDDTLDGGEGFDLVDYSGDGGSAGVTVILPRTVDGVLQDGTATDSHGDRDILREIESVSGTRQADSISGGDGDDSISGQGGNDTVSGGAGFDTLDFFGFSSGQRLVISDPDTGAGTMTTGGFFVGNTVTFDGFEAFVFGRRAEFAQTGGADVTLTMGGGADTVQGGAGVEIVSGGAGNDAATLRGGDDTYFYVSGADRVQGGAGNDSLSLAEATVGLAINALEDGEVVVVTSSDIARFSGFELLTLSPQADELLGTTASIAAEGGAGNDTLTGSSAGDRLDGGEGNDSILGEGGNDTLIGGAGLDTIRGGTGDDVIRVTDRAIVSGGLGTDQLDYSQLDFSLDVTPGLVDLGGGQRTVFSGIEEIAGSINNDIFDIIDNAGTTGGLQKVLAGAGNDEAIVVAQTASGTRVTDFTFDGGEDFDIVDMRANGGTTGLVAGVFQQIGVIADLDIDSAFTPAASSGRAGQIGLIGVEGILGSAHIDILEGDSGPNLFVGGGAHDEIDGRGGIDTVDYSREDGGRGVRVFLNGFEDLDRPDGAPGENRLGNAVDTSGSGDSLWNIENVIGTARADFLQGGRFDNVLEGGAGNDTLRGGQGDDTLVDGPGRDVLNGGGGNDVLVHEGGFGAAPRVPETWDGGAGLDVLDLTNAAGGVNVSLAAGAVSLAFETDAVFGGGGLGPLLRITGIESIVGSRIGDVIDGDDAANLLFGGRGDDVLSGRLGLDTLDGGEGFDLVDLRDAEIGVTADLTAGLVRQGDTLTDRLANIEGVVGTTGADTLIGDDGDNVFAGLDGNDLIIGGGGRDALDLSLIRPGSGVTVLLDAAGREAELGASPVDGGGLMQDPFGGLDRIFGIADVTGTLFADRLVGDALGNLLDGGEGADTIEPGAGDDTVIGGEGADTVVIAPGGDSVRIEDFDPTEDILDLTAFDLDDVTNALATRPSDGALLEDGALLSFRDGTTVQFVGLAPEDIDGANILQPDGAPVEASADDDGGRFAGSDVSEALTGSDEADRILAEGGDDTIQPGLGDDTVDGGTGIDRVDYSDAPAGLTIDLASNRATGDSGTDILRNIEQVTGSDFADTLIGTLNADSLDAGSGNDVVRPGGGPDVVSLGAGSDVIRGSVTDFDGVEVTDFGFDDTLILENVRLGSDSVLLTSGTADAAVFEVDGDADGLIDSTFVFSGDFTDARFLLTRTAEGHTELVRTANLNAGVLLREGNDFLFSRTLTSASDRIFDGGGGDDFLVSTGPRNALIGSDGDDFLNTNALASDTTIAGGEGVDLYSVGGIRDTLIFDSADFPVGTSGREQIFSFDQADDILHLSGFGFESIADLDIQKDGRKSEITIGAWTIEVFIDSGAALTNDNFLFGLAELTTIVGLAEALRLTASDDEFRGRDTRDDLVLGRGGDDSLRGGKGNDSLLGASGKDTLEGGNGADSLDGGNSQDSLVGGAGADTLVGGKGQDDQAGGNGKDSLKGGAGNDTLTGGKGADLLDGGRGRDLLAGGAGVDTLIGGDGNDTLTGGKGADLFRFDAGFGADRITDFDPAVDVLALPTGIGEAETFRQFRAASVNTDEGLLYDANGDGRATILLEGVKRADLTRDMLQFEDPA